MPRSTGRRYHGEAKYAAGRAFVRKAIEYIPGAAGVGYAAYKGGAAAIPGKDAGKLKRRRRKRAKAKKCAKMKGYALKQEVCKLSNAVKELKHSEAASLALMTHRRYESTRVISNLAAQGVGWMSAQDTASIEAVLANLKYYDPSNPATLVTAAAATGTYQKDFLLKSTSARLLLKNNYMSDAEITVYLCTPKIILNATPSSAWGSGIADDAGNVASAESYGSFPTDYETTRSMWNFKRVLKKCLSPGESASCNHSIENLQYDPAFVDAFSETYQPKMKSYGFLIVVHGGIAHDSVVTTEQGVNRAGVDCQLKVVTKVQYDAGVNMTYVIHDDNQDQTATNGFLESHQPVSDNITYSMG